MDNSPASRFFLEPKETLHRHFEALRAIFVDGEPLDRVAARFGYKLSALKSMASRLRTDCRRGISPPFFSPTVAGALPDRAAIWAQRNPNRRRSPTVAS
jgi:hypothetical protein